MTKSDKESLRQRAEAALKLTGQQVKQMPLGEIQGVVCELQLHQMELEMQNENLRHTQLKLDLAHKRYTDLYDFAPVGYLTVDAHSQIVEANPVAFELLENSQAHLIGSCLEQYINPMDQPALRAHLLATRQSGQKETIELTLHRPEGPLCIVSCTTQVNSGNLSTLPMSYIALADVTRKRRLEDTIREQNTSLRTLVKKRTQKIRSLLQQRMESQKLTALGQLAAGIAHEINNPLAALMYAFHLVKKAIPSTHPHAHFVKKMDTEFQRLSNIIRHMYQLYGSQPFTTSTTRVEAIIQDTLQLVRRKLEERALTIHFNDFDQTKVMTVPTGPLVQILANILSNAIEISPVGGQVRMNLEQTHDVLLIHITDTGPGIDPKILPHLFEPFYSTKSKSTQSGMGLGLSISRSLAIQMGGDLIAASQPGMGSTFTVKVPMQGRVEETPSVTPTSQSREKNQAAYKILLVDDEPIYLEATQTILCDAGYSCEAASNIEDALTKLESPRDLLISDVGLPGNTALSFFQEVHNRWPDLAVVLMSGSPQDITRVEHEVPDLSIKGSFAKPICFEEICHMIEEIMAKQPEESVS